MQHKRTDKEKLPPAMLRKVLKLIGNLSRTGMEAGNKGNFDKAFLNMEDAMSYAKELDKKCLEAKLLNNMGLLHTMQGSWDTAMLTYEKCMDIVVTHYGTQNILYKTLQKNIAYLFKKNTAVIN
jgi:tetratricopeptide (TPR) repeat protein